MAQSLIWVRHWLGGPACVTAGWPGYSTRSACSSPSAGSACTLRFQARPASIRQHGPVGEPDHHCGRRRSARHARGAGRPLPRPRESYAQKRRAGGYPMRSSARPTSARGVTHSCGRPGPGPLGDGSPAAVRTCPLAVPDPFARTGTAVTPVPVTGPAAPGRYRYTPAHRYPPAYRYQVTGARDRPDDRRSPGCHGLASAERHVQAGTGPCSGAPPAAPIAGEGERRCPTAPPNQDPARRTCDSGHPSRPVFTVAAPRRLHRAGRDPQLVGYPTGHQLGTNPASWVARRPTPNQLGTGRYPVWWIRRSRFGASWVPATTRVPQ